MYLRFKWQFALRLSGYIFRPLSGCMVWTLANKKLFLGLISYCSPVVTSSRNLAGEVDECLSNGGCFVGAQLQQCRTGFSIGIW